MKKNVLVLAAVLVTGSTGMVTVSGEAAAQGTDGPFARGNKSCPTAIYKQEGSMCIPTNGKKASRKVYPLPSNRQCVAGYKPAGVYCEEIPGWKPEKAAGAPSGGGSASSSNSGRSNAGSAPQTVGITLAKANPLQLCPTGYRTSGDSKRCETIHQGAPAARAKGSGGCAAGEIEEFGAWCTSTDTSLRVEQMENITIGDFNRIFTQNGRRDPVPARTKFITPLMELKTAEGAVASVNASAGGAQTAVAKASDAPQQPTPCAKPKKKGLGRAIGGAVGAVVGAAVDAAEGC